MTMRSKQWFTKASRLENSFAKSSIGPSALRSCLVNSIIGQAAGGIKISNIFG
jgi:hypothetical protein